MRRGYDILLDLNSEEQPFIAKRKSLWRRWNQLSRLQRNLIASLFIVACFVGAFIVTRPNNSSLSSSEFNLDLLPAEENALFSDRKVLISKNEVPNNAVNVGLNVDSLKDSLVENKKGVPSTSRTELELQLEEKVKVEEIIGNKLFDVQEAQNEKNVLAPPPNEVVGSDSAKSKVSGSDVHRVERPGRIEFNTEWNPRQRVVVDAFQHAWRGYKKYAWGFDNLKPISRTGSNWFHLGLTIVDSLDSMYIMGLQQEFDESRDWVNSGLSFNGFNDVNLFEVTIRVLGGLLSAFHLSKDDLFLSKAVDLGERLLPCFSRSPSAIPYSDVNLATHIAHSPRWGPDSSTSEVTTIQLEFRDLARTSKLSKFEAPAANVSAHVHTLPKTDGLVPVFINPKTGQFQHYADIKLGARGDSYYEYLLKQWIQTGKTVEYLKEDYLLAVEGIKKHLVRRTPNNNLLFIGELKGGSRDFVPKMDHLACYLPGTLALGYYHGLPKSHLDLATELMYTCYRTYSERPTFLAPEITYFNLQEDGRGDMYVMSNDAHNLLRPEFIESLWYMYQITGNTTYQDWGWNIFKAFEKYTKVENGYTSIGNVNNPVDVKPKDMMESFFLSETLKYFYLLFADDRKLLDLNKYVLNSEAHPLPILSS